MSEENEENKLKKLPIKVNIKFNEMILRVARSYGKNPYEYLEIIKEKNDYCYTIASFNFNKDNQAHLEFCLDRYKDIDWEELKIVIDMGYEICSHIEHILNGEKWK